MYEYTYLFNILNSELSASGYGLVAGICPGSFLFPPAP